jgi:hypothetical protein
MESEIRLYSYIYSRTQYKNFLSFPKCTNICDLKIDEAEKLRIMNLVDHYYPHFSNARLFAKFSKFIFGEKFIIGASHNINLSGIWFRYFFGERKMNRDSDPESFRQFGLVFRKDLQELFLGRKQKQYSISAIFGMFTVLCEELNKNRRADILDTFLSTAKIHIPLSQVSIQKLDISLMDIIVKHSSPDALTGFLPHYGFLGIVGRAKQLVRSHPEKFTVQAMIGEIQDECEIESYWLEILVEIARNNPT